VTAADLDLQASIDLPFASSSVPVARNVVGQLLTGWSAQSLQDDAVLLLSELVTNVLRHVDQRPPLRIELHLSGHVLRVAVLDTSTARPGLREQAASGGHGLRLIAAIAEDWGAERHDHGKRVWFELAHDSWSSGGQGATSPA
jgi:anti-sigma regulatory factor (Ser/Thr protein kinase)